jgi:thymidylate synthase (FAD)
MRNSAKLVGYTNWIGGNPASTLVDTIAECARVSNPSGPRKSSNEKLVRYLIKERHWSPLEMANIVLDVTTDRTVSRQVLRHSLHVQEFSQRYSATETTSGVYEARMQDTANRQNSLECDDEDTADWWTERQMNLRDHAFTLYDQALKKGIAKEVARAILPEGLTLTRMFLNGNVRNWCHYVAARTAPDTQKEHRDLAFNIVSAIEPVFPMITDFVYSSTTGVDT